MSTVEHRNKELVVEFMKVFSTGDVDRILTYLDDSATWWVAGNIDGISGEKTKKEFAEILSAQSAYLKTGAITLTPKRWTAEADRVAVETESYAELANGRVYNNLYHFAFVIRNGKIQKVKEFMDTEHVREVFVAT
ncbi:hypothetical protein CBI38_32880 (plasmid) [Rhodococcus oxybenzonivorans]|uniref:SnoaL-like domain-containing protein n=1 Tax=Rhodococcus oxybenzonivorans TaxID=1990687 RepID=A0A2S2C785_9NOCA|nr:nuclear transport factor 2 family protein [Rhodococcus oxybenzonivorans]AWK76683.1 hypothetical protein CBI38_32880 [Rhodococcus oxybenzonivorans]